MSRYWQIAAGSSGRDYSSLFIKFGMALVGGSPHIDKMNNVNIGDVIVLKQGTQKILAAGKVVQRNGQHKGVADKEWLKDFDGWDLQAYCYVDWKKSSIPVAINGLTRTTIQQLRQQKHINAADQILQHGVTQTPSPEPPKTNRVDDSEIL
jgi:hypothetical protein